jgi:hypothetical protein
MFRTMATSRRPPLSRWWPLRAAAAGRMRRPTTPTWCSRNCHHLHCPTKTTRLNFPTILRRRRRRIRRDHYHMYNTRRIARVFRGARTTRNINHHHVWTTKRIIISHHSVHHHHHHHLTTTMTMTTTITRLNFPAMRSNYRRAAAAHHHP